MKYIETDKFEKLTKNKNGVQHEVGKSSGSVLRRHICG